MRIERPEHMALMLLDLQNDFVHPDGAYARGGQRSETIAALPERLAPVAGAVRAAGGWIVSPHFTLVPGRGGEPFISAHLRELRPFLRKGDFSPGAFGHALVDALQPTDLSVDKVAYSAFHQSRLEWVLGRARVDTLVFAGIVTNGGVASTVRDAHTHDFRVLVLSDGCAAFDPSAHETGISALSTVATILTCDELVSALGT